jgi:hypothetical protein
MTFQQYRHHRADFIFILALNFARPCHDQYEALQASIQNHIHENRVACPAGSGAGRTRRRRARHWRRAGLDRNLQGHQFEGDSGMLVFFTFMPLGAVIGGLGGALAFGVMAIRDAEIAIQKEPARRHDS